MLPAPVVEPFGPRGRGQRLGLLARRDPLSVRPRGAGATDRRLGHPQGAPDRRVRRLRSVRGGDEFESGSADQNTVVRHEWHAEADGGCGDPAVAVVKLAPEGVASLLTSQAQFGANGDRLVTG